MQESEEITKSPKSPAKRRKSLGKLSKDEKSTGSSKGDDSSKSRTRSKSRSRSKSPGKLKSVSDKSPKSPGKNKSRRGSKTWWTLDLEEDDDEREARLLEEARVAQEEEEQQRRRNSLQKFKERHVEERNSSVQKGMVARLLAQQKERPNKPTVLDNVRATPLKLDISKFEAPNFKKNVEQKTLVKQTAKNNFIMKDLASNGAKTDIKKLVRAFESVEVDNGKDIVKQGNEGSHMYVVEKGTVDFQVNGVTVRTAGVGTTFGEKNLLFQAPEDATVIANNDDNSPTMLLRLHQETFRGIMQTTEEHLREKEAPEPPPEKSGSWIENCEFMKYKESIQSAIKLHVGPDDLERVKVLGEGQFGEVWLVETDLPGVAVPAGQDRHQFALKIQSLDVPGTEKIVRSEIKAMESLSHPFISCLYHCFDDVATSIEMVLGLVPGGELWDVVHKENEETGEWLSGIPESHAQFYSFVVADTLSFIHEQQYVFRDLKPENIMIDADGYPIIVDFGFAKPCPDKTFTFCGTPNYVAPEIIKNSGHDFAVDWWALGIVIYEMISGENPFFYDDMEQMALFEAICDEDGEPLGKQFSKSVRDLVDKLLVKDPAKRLGSLKGKGRDVLKHKFYAGLNLDKIRARKVKGPWIPGQERDLSVEYNAEAQQAMKRAEEEERMQAQEQELIRLQKEEEERRRKRQEEVMRLQEEQARLKKEAEEKKRQQEELARRQEEEREAEERRKEEERQLLLKKQEEERLLREEKQRLLEEERRKEEERQLLLKKQEEERLQREEKQRFLEEERRKEEERQLLLKKQEEERLQREEEQRLLEEERQRKILLQKQEEERLRQEEEQRLREEEEERQKLEEERQKAEEQQRKLEEEKKRLEEARLKDLEEKRLEQERLQEEEEERIRREEQERKEKRKKKAAREERKRQEEERLEKEREERKKRLAKKKEEELRKQQELEEKTKLEEQMNLEGNQDEEVSMEDLERRHSTSRQGSMEESWNSTVSPAGRQRRSIAALVSPVPKGHVAKMVNERGQNYSPGALVSPRVQEELSKSVKKGLVASRLSQAREMERLGSSVPSLFTNFEL
eukprot:Nitzschia sp. Nitz4//scaffold4_size323378//266116//269358//NITZ4_000704-RA/size323378-processed-gene-0.383-mRNA-1//-1//CDS//3329553531//5227//frame0